MTQKRIVITLPEIENGCVRLNGITEPPMEMEHRLMILNYKVGNLNEHLLKEMRLHFISHRLEFEMNLAEAICHCLTIAVLSGYDVQKLVEKGWEKIGDRFKDFEKDWTPLE